MDLLVVADRVFFKKAKILRLAKAHAMKGRRGR
jgi:hypothetical protein